MGMNIKNDFMEERLRGMFTYSDVSETIDDTNYPIRILREQVSDLNYKVNGIENYIKFLACLEDATLVSNAGLPDNFLYRLVSHNKDIFWHIEDKSESFIINCLKIRPELIINMPLATDDMYKTSLSLNPTLYTYLKDYPDWLDNWLVTAHPKNMMLIRNQTTELCQKAIMTDYRSLEYIRDISPEICRYAYAVNKESIRFMDCDIPEEIWKDYLNDVPERIVNIPNNYRTTEMRTYAIRLKPEVVISCAIYYTSEEIKLAVSLSVLVYPKLSKNLKSKSLFLLHYVNVLTSGFRPNRYEITYEDE